MPSLRYRSLLLYHPRSNFLSPVCYPHHAIPLSLHTDGWLLLVPFSQSVQAHQEQQQWSSSPKCNPDPATCTYRFNELRRSGAWSFATLSFSSPKISPAVGRLSPSWSSSRSRMQATSTSSSVSTDAAEKPIRQDTQHSACTTNTISSSSSFSAEIDVTYIS